MNNGTETSLDLVWIQQTLNGNADAFRNLVQKYHGKFLGLAMRVLKNQAEAEDVLQASFIQAYRHLSDFQNRSSFSTWFHTIVLNHARNYLRHKKVLRWVPLEHDSDSDDYKPPEIADKGPGLDVALEQKMEIEAVHKAIGQLPLQYKSVFILHYFNGLLLKDIARQLNRPLGTVKAYLHRARRLVLERLAATPFTNIQFNLNRAPVFTAYENGAIPK